MQRLYLREENLGARCCLRIMDFFAIVSSSLAGEGSADLLQQGAGLFIGVRGGADDHIHAADLVDLVVLDLGEDQLLLHAQGIVAAAVEGVSGDAAEAIIRFPSGKKKK